MVGITPAEKAKNDANFEKNLSIGCGMRYVCDPNQSTSYRYPAAIPTTAGMMLARPSLMKSCPASRYVQLFSENTTPSRE